MTFPVNPITGQLHTSKAGSIYEFTAKGAWKNITSEDTLIRDSNIFHTLNGSTTTVSGFDAAVESVASMNVVVSRGTIFAPAVLETAGSTTHTIMKQATLWDSIKISFTPPVAQGYSIVYVIQARYQDFANDPNDNSSTVTNFTNASLSKLKYGRVEFSVKNGMPALTGAQIAPSADTGWIGLWAVTVANGQISLVQSNISLYPNAPFIYTKLINVPVDAQSGKWNSFNDTSTSISSLATNPVLVNTVPVANLINGTTFRIKMKFAAIASQTVTLNGINYPIAIQTGGYLKGTEWASNDIVTLTYNNGTFVTSALTTSDIVNVYNQNFAVTTATTKVVYGTGADYPDLNAAYQWLSQKKISTTGSVTFSIPAGTWPQSTKLSLAHPDGTRISIIGSALKASLPLPSQLQCSGYIPSVQTADGNANIATLRNCYATEINFPNATGGMVIDGGCSLTNILVTGNNTVPAQTISNGVNVYNFGLASAIVSTGSLNLTRCAVYNFWGVGIIANGGFSVTDSLFVLNCGYGGIITQAGTSFYGHLGLFSCGVNSNANASSGAVGYSAQNCVTAFNGVNGANNQCYICGHANGALGLTGALFAATQVTINNNASGDAQAVVQLGANSTFNSSTANINNNSAGSRSVLLASHSNMNFGLTNIVNNVCNYAVTAFDGTVVIFGTAGSAVGGGNTGTLFFATSGSVIARGNVNSAGYTNTLATPAVGSTGNNNAYIG